MTEKPMNQDSGEGDEDLEKLAASDPADAPQLAEDLADRLAGELDATSGPNASTSEGTS